MDKNNPPVFAAKTSSVRQILSLLKCIGFISKAQVQISSEGLRVTVEDSRVMQGMYRFLRCSRFLPITSILPSLGHAFLDKNLFSEYCFNLPGGNPLLNIAGGDAEDDDTEDTVSFGISLAALLECLQIFGADSSSRERWSQGGFINTMEHGGASENQLAKPTGTCDFIYHGEGHTLDLM